MGRVLYRIAAVLTVLFDLGHTVGYPWSDPAWRVDLHAIQSTHFNVLGSSRTYWQFYVGFGLTISVLLLLPAIAAWQLGSPAPQDAQRRVIAWALVLTFAALTVLNIVFFFIVPIVFSAAITVCLAMAALWPSSAMQAGRPSV